MLLLQVNNAPELWRDTRDRIHAARTAGVEVTGQVGSRPIGVMWGLETSNHPFSTHPAWLALSHLSPAERYDRLQRDADLRRVLVEERPNDEHTRMIEAALPRTYALDDSYDYEPHIDDSITARAARGWHEPVGAGARDDARRRRQAAADAHVRELLRGRPRRGARD